MACSFPCSIPRRQSIKSFAWRCKVRALSIILLACAALPLLWMTGSPTLAADPKTEAAALRAELAKAQEALATTNLKNKQLVAALSVQIAAGSRSATAGRVVAADNNAQAVAASNDAYIQATRIASVADANALIAQQAVAAATAAAASAATQARADQFHGQIMLMMTSLFGFAGVIAGFLYNAYTAQRDRRWAREDSTARHKEGELRASSDKNELLAAVHAGAKDSSQAIEKSNHLTEKIVEMREDLVTAVAATNAATAAAAIIKVEETRKLA